MLNTTAKKTDMKMYVLMRMYKMKNRAKTELALYAGILQTRNRLYLMQKTDIVIRYKIIHSSLV